MKRMIIGLVLLTAWGVTGAGCSPYINIPPLAGDVASHDPNNINVPRAERVALAEALRRFPPEGQYVVALPEGSEPEAYRKVLERLPAGGRPIEADEPSEAIYEVASVYIRGTNGQVDVIPPARGGGQPQLFTVYLDYGFNGWQVERTRQWNIPVERALRSATPADEAPADRAPTREQRRGSQDEAEQDEPANGGSVRETPSAPATPESDRSPSQGELLPPREVGPNDHILDSQPN